MVYSETRQAQARRWAKFPATVLFALSAVWLVYSFFNYVGHEGFRDQITYGSGIARVVLDMLLIPVGGAVIGIYLLLRKRWAAPVAALLPLAPLGIASADKLRRIAIQFHDYNVTGEFSAAGNGLNHLLQLVAFWALYGLMLLYLWKVWTLLHERPRWNVATIPATGDTASAAKGTEARSADGEVCFLMPETDEAESA